MSVPSHPFEIRGGCNCRSVRYKLTVPTFSERPLNIYCDNEHVSDEKRFPMVVLDHCNDCRRATGALIPAWICGPTAFISASCIPRTQKALKNRKEVGDNESEGDDDRVWYPAEDILHPDSEMSKDSWLQWYASSEVTRRAFCGRCGTNLFYTNLVSYKKHWPKMIDIALGSVDHNDLEKEELRPDRQLWCNFGIDWVKELVRDGKACDGMPMHPLWKMNETIE